MQILVGAIEGAHAFRLEQEGRAVVVVEADLAQAPLPVEADRRALGAQVHAVLDSARAPTPRRAPGTAPAPPRAAPRPARSRRPGSTRRPCRQTHGSGSTQGPARRGCRWPGGELPGT